VTLASETGGGATAPLTTTLRPRLELDGPWQFEFVSEDGERQAMPDILVPSVWQAQYAELRHAFGTGIHRRCIAVPPGWAGSAVYLCVGAANYRTEVLTDGVPVGTHDGGYLPFAFDLGDRLTPGTEAQLTLRVTLPSQRPRAEGEPSFADIPHGKQSWYGPLGGVWQSIWLEARPQRHIRDLRLGTDSEGTCRARLALGGPTSSAGRECVRLTVRDHDDRVAAQSEHVAHGSQVDLGATVDAPDLWSPDHPVLYHVSVELLRDGTVVDEMHRMTGFRSIAAHGGELRLNGKPFVLRGALDQDYYLDSLCTPPSEEFLEDQLRKAKALGFNCLRCHIKAPDPRYLEVADRLGMLLWCEMPNWGQWSPEAAERGLATLAGMIARDDHHPSIMAWTIVNEDWGTDLTVDPQQRDWVKQAYRRIKALDPSRLVIDNSPCEPNFHLLTDIADYHFYRGIPDQRDEWDAFVDAFAGRRCPLFSPHGDAEPTGDEPLIVSEFGNWGLPRPDALRDKDGRQPWWFDTGSDWGEGVMLARGIETRFRQYHLDRVFGTLDRFVAATQEQQFQALKHAIESMRARPEIAGYVVTELTDTHWEANGLMDMARTPRDFSSRFAALNADTVLRPRVARHGIRPGDSVAVELAVAHDAHVPVEGAMLRWRWDDGREGAGRPVPTLARGVHTLPTLAINVPSHRTPGDATLHLQLVERSGAVRARTEVTLTILPANSALSPLPAVWPANPGLSHWLEDAGIPTVPDHSAADVIAATRLDGELVALVRRGARLLLLVDEPDAIPSPPGVVPVYPEFPRAAVASRDNSVWRGDWASGFSWLRRSGPYREIPGPPLLGNAFARVMPRHVLLGFRTDDFADDVRAGIVIGWIHRGAALIGRRRLGHGHAVISTLPVHRPAAAGDPVARLLSRALLRDAVEQTR